MTGDQKWEASARQLEQYYITDTKASAWKTRLQNVRTLGHCHLSALLFHETDNCAAPQKHFEIWQTDNGRIQGTPTRATLFK